MLIKVESKRLLLSSIVVQDPKKAPETNMYACCKICGGIVEQSVWLSVCGYLFHTECLECFHENSHKPCAGCGTNERDGCEHPLDKTYRAVCLRRASIDREDENHLVLWELFEEVLMLEAQWRRDIFLPELGVFLRAYYDKG